MPLDTIPRGFTPTAEDYAAVCDAVAYIQETFYELYATKDDCLLAIYDEAAQCIRGAVRHDSDLGRVDQLSVDHHAPCGFVTSCRA